MISFSLLLFPPTFKIGLLPLCTFFALSGDSLIFKLITLRATNQNHQLKIEAVRIATEYFQFSLCKNFVRRYFHTRLDGSKFPLTIFLSVMAAIHLHFTSGGNRIGQFAESLMLLFLRSNLRGKLLRLTFFPTVCLGKFNIQTYH